VNAIYFSNITLCWFSRHTCLYISHRLNVPRSLPHRLLRVQPRNSCTRILYFIWITPRNLCGARCPTPISTCLAILAGRCPSCSNPRNSRGSNASIRGTRATCTCVSLLLSQLLCTCVCIYECMYVCVYVCMYVCMHVCMYACLFVCVCVHCYTIYRARVCRPPFSLRFMVILKGQLAAVKVPRGQERHAQLEYVLVFSAGILSPCRCGFCSMHCVRLAFLSSVLCLCA
jgi:hypothetical protein